jgi:hypothetical protein
MIELLFQPKKKQSTRIFVASVYAPQSGITAKNPEYLHQFHQALSELTQLTNRKKNSPTEKRFTIMGGDWNASIGVRDNQRIDETKKILGQYGIKHINEAGEKLLDTMQEQALRAPHTYFIPKKKTTLATFYDALHERRPLTLDFFLTSQKMGNRITSAKVFRPKGGPISDHHAMRMKIRLTQKMQRNHANKLTAPLDENPEIRTFTNWDKLKEEGVKEHFQKKVDEILSMDDEETIKLKPTSKILSTAIMTAAKALLQDTKKNHSDWFKMSADLLMLTRDRLRAAHDDY